MGLHRAYDVQDFVKVPMHLTANEHAEWIRTWESCNIVAQRYSILPVAPIARDLKRPATDFFMQR
jgi:hypothetical protein